MKKIFVMSIFCLLFITIISSSANAVNFDFPGNILGFVLSSTATQDTRCTDSDGGLDIYTTGDIVSVLNTGTFRSTDRCLSDGKILEYTCKNDAWYANYDTCPNGCQDGACLISNETTQTDTCIDSDGGIDYDVKGILETKTATSAGTYYDLCWNAGNELHEWNCKGVQPQEIIYTCPNGCQDGACLPEDETIPDDTLIEILDEQKCETWHANNVFNYPPCGNQKIYPITAQETLTFKAIADGCADCVCYHMNFDIYDLIDGVWTKTKTIDRPDTKGTSHTFDYVATGNKMKVVGTNGCFHLNIYKNKKGVVTDPINETCPNNDCTTPEQIKRDIPCDTYGDVDLDGFITDNDHKILSENIAGLKTLTEQQLQNAEVSNDGVVDAWDATVIARYVKGEIDTFSSCDKIYICTETDGGANYDIKGRLDYKDFIDYDNCLKSKNDGTYGFILVTSCAAGEDCFVNEGICDTTKDYNGMPLEFKVQNCLGGCNDGACIAQVDIIQNETFIINDTVIINDTNDIIVINDTVIINETNNIIIINDTTDNTTIEATNDAYIDTINYGSEDRIISFIVRDYLGMVELAGGENDTTAFKNLEVYFDDSIIQVTPAPYATVDAYMLVAVTNQKEDIEKITVTYKGTIQTLSIDKTLDKQKNCPEQRCENDCKNGFKDDGNGCPICSCKNENGKENSIVAVNDISGQTNPTTSNCAGCLIENECISSSTRFTSDGIASYCSVSNEIVSQKYDEDTCQNNFECRTNFCTNDICVDIAQNVDETNSLMEQILAILTKLFSI